MFDWWKDLTLTSKTLIFLFLTLALSTITFLAGIYTDSTGLIVISGIIRSTTTLVILGGVAGVAVMISALTGKGAESAKFFGGVLGSVFVAQLMTTLLVSIIPLRNLPKMIPVFLLAAFILTIFGFWTKFRGVTLTIVLVVFVGLGVAFFFPGQFQRLTNDSSRKDEVLLVPRLVSITYPDTTNGKVIFFGPAGENRYWYWFDPETRSVSTFEVIGDSYFHPQNGQRLLPLTREAFGGYQKYLREEWEHNQRALREQAERVQAEREKAEQERMERERLAREQAERVRQEQFFQAEKEREEQAERDRQAQAERETQAQAERARQEQAERERQAQAERERAEQAARVSYTRPEPPRPNFDQNLANRFISAKSMVNLPQSTEVAVFLTDQEYRSQDRPSREIAGKLLLFNINATGDFFNRSSAFDVMARLYQGDRQLIADLDLPSRVDFLVLGIMVDLSSSGRRGRREDRRGQLKIRIIPTREDARGFEELPPFLIEGGSSRGSNDGLARFIINQIVERLRA